MPKKNKGSKKSAGVTYCRGYVDEHGQWNNGFYCPQWGGPSKQYCCGSDTHRFCCPRTDIIVKKASLLEKNLPLICSLIAACVVLVIILVVVICYFCRGCWVYRRRKRMQNGSTLCSNQPGLGARVPGYTVSYSVCPHPPYLPDGMSHSVCYPMDDPPPYPGDGQHSINEKQPLNPSHLYVSMETPEELISSTERRSPAQDARGSGCDGTSARPCRCEPEALSHSSSAATAIVRDVTDENIEDINVSGDFHDVSSPDSIGGPHHVIINHFRNATTGDSASPEAAYATLRDFTPEQINLAAHPCRADAACSSVPTKTLEIGAYLLSLQGQNQSSEESTDLTEVLPTTKLLSEHDEERPVDNAPKTYLGQQEVTSPLSSYPPEALFSMDDPVIQIIPQG